MSRRTRLDLETEIAILKSNLESKDLQCIMALERVRERETTIREREAVIVDLNRKLCAIEQDADAALARQAKRDRFVIDLLFEQSDKTK